MSPYRHDSDRRSWWSKLLIWLTLIYLILTLILFASGCLGYLSGDFIEYTLNILKGWEGLCLVLLLGMPIFALAVCMGGLLLRARRDEDAYRFHLFCLVLMSLTPCSYCFLWCCYIYGWFGKYPTPLSWIAFGLVLALIIPVVYMTWLIMWTPENPSPALKESDVKQKRWRRFCERLKENMEAASKTGSTSLAGLFDDEVLQNYIRNQNLPTRLRGHLIDALNKLLSEPKLDETADLKDCHERESHFHSGYALEVYNRGLIDSAYSDVLEKRSWLAEKGRDAKAWGDNNHKRLKDGVTKSPFWAMVFFFTIFLGITYLLGFAFAFHDKATREATEKPALFSPRSPLYGVGEYQAGNSDAGAQTWPEYVFYFDSYSAMPRYYETEFNHKELKEWAEKRREHELAEATLKGGHLSVEQKKKLGDQHLSKEKLKELTDALLAKHAQWKEWQNTEHLNRLVDAIVREDDAKHGQGLLLQVRGSADDRKVNAGEAAGVNYPSNYTLSEARAQAVRYALLERLAKRGTLHSGLQWVILPLSNEDPSLPPPPDETRVPKGNAEGDQIAAVTREVNEIAEHPDAENASRDLCADEKRQAGVGLIKYLSDMGLCGARRSPKAALSKYLDEINKLKGGKGLDDARAGQFVNKLRLYKQLLLERDRPIEEDLRAQAENLKQARSDLEDMTQDFEYDHIDGDARKRVVVVTIRPVRQSLGHMYAPLSLMDYMYFTIYTITTTGYGDIVPTTTYAKFLCSSANILEVFFFVVFFNGLLSMRKSREDSFAEAAEQADGPPHGAGTWPAGTQGKEQANGELGLSDLKQLVEKNQETLNEVKMLLQQRKGLRGLWSLISRGNDDEPPGV